MSERGVVKWFSNTKGYGFIKMENGQDAFAHYSDIAGAPGDYKTLEEGMRVEFDILQTERGPKAVNIVKAEEGEAPPTEEDEAPFAEEGEAPPTEEDEAPFAEEGEAPPTEEDEAPFAEEGLPPL